MKLLLFLPNWVGDAVMATPALRALRQQFPQAEIVGVMRPVIADVLAGSELIDQTILYAPKGSSPEQRGGSVTVQLRAAACDTAILFTNSIRTAWLAWLSGAKRRIGFDRDLRRWLLTDPLISLPRSQPHPVLDEYLRLVQAVGCESTNRVMSLAVTASEQQAFEKFWSRHPQALRTNGVVAINGGGAFGPAKNWPRESFVELARRIADVHRKTVLLLCGPAEREDAAWIAERVDRPQVVSLADEPLSVGLTKAVIREAELLVTTDSGPRHFAAAFDVPVITLFGPTHIAWSETYFPKATHLQIAVDCGPCQQRVCPAGHHKCMRGLTVDQVFQAVTRQLQTQPQRDAA